MAEDTGIAWATSTWNPFRGCTKVSEGCTHCYAETLSKRNPTVLGTWGPEEIGVRVVGAESDWQRPFTWNNKAALRRPWRVFCASLADVFEDWAGPMVATNGVQVWRRTRPVPNVPGTGNGGEWTTSDHYRDTVALTMNDVRARVFRVMESTLNLTWLVLTKRPENVLRMVPPAWREAWPGHVWIGTTTENQARADERIPELLRVPAAVRWLSVEPQLGPVDLEPYLQYPPFHEHYKMTFGCSEFHGVQWVITGGESGHGARPYKMAWARDLVRQCQAANVSVFVKQLGSNPEGDDFPPEVPDPITRRTTLRVRQMLTITDRAGADPAEWPSDLRVQEFPEARA